MKINHLQCKCGSLGFNSFIADKKIYLRCIKCKNLIKILKSIKHGFGYKEIKRE